MRFRWLGLGGRKRRRFARRKRRRVWQASSPKIGEKEYQVAVPAYRRERPRFAVLSYRVLSALLLVVAGWTLYWFTNDDTFYIHGVRVEGNWRLPEAELLALSGLEGVNVFWADTKAAERAIEALPDIQSARVRCRLPADCVIDLVERPASLVWRQGDAQVWIGAGGIVVPARGELPNAIVLDAVGSAALKPGDRLDPALLEAVEELEQLQPQVRVYHYSDQYGLSFRDAHGWLVRLGKGPGTAEKLSLLRVITEHLLRQGIEPAFVDVRYPEAPYYKE